MKKNDIIDLRTKPIDELKRMVLDLRNEINHQRSEKMLGKVKNTNAIRVKQKDLARVLTVLHMKKILDVSEVKVEEKEASVTAQV